MDIEIEAKFLNCTHEDIRQKLRSIGAHCEFPVRLMRRAIIDYPDRRLQTSIPNSYIRVRDEGDKTTLTYKQFDSLSVDGAREIEVVVDSFLKTVDVFTAAGLEVVSMQESKRETWKYKEREVVLDEWPWLNPYIEIEGESEESLKDLATKLELRWTDAVFGDVMVAYRAQYPYLTVEQTIGKLPEVRFNTPPPAFFTE